MAQAMSNLPKLIVFDFDGTIVDTKPIYVEACSCYANENGLGELNLAGFIKAYGSPNVSNVDLGFSCSESEKLTHLKRIYVKTDTMIDGGCLPPLFQGVEKALSYLHEAKSKLSIVTSRPLKPVLTILKQHGLEKYFSIIRSQDDVAARNMKSKPHPDKLLSVLQEASVEKSDSLVIGDTWLDLEMALAAGVKAIAVSWGFGEKESLAPYNVPILQESMMEMLQA